MKRTWLLACTVVLLAFAAGCTGGGGGGGGSGSADWCGTGSFESVVNQQGASGSVSAELKGTTERDGREVCQVSYEFEGDTSQFARMDVFYSENYEYVQLVYYDEDGNVVQQIDYSGQMGSGTDGSSDGSGTDDGSSDGSDGSDGSSDGGDGSTDSGTDDGTGTTGESTSWCQAGQSYTSTNPQQGSQTSYSIEGMVERDGRMVCKASYEFTGEDLPYSRVEMFYTEDQSYQEVVYYDENGNVVYEIDVSDGS